MYKKRNARKQKKGRNKMQERMEKWRRKIKETKENEKKPGSSSLK